MHASTCIDAPTLVASAAIAGMSSMTPCGYCGAEPTTSTVFALTRAAIASTSARQSSRTFVLCRVMPKYDAALWNAACALSGSTISGAVMPRSALPRSRAAFTAIKMLSVPPDVMNPAAVSGPCRSDATAPTTSDWISPSEGNAIVLSAFSWR